MSQGVFDLSVWLEPFGLVKNEIDSEDEFLGPEALLLDIVAYLIIIAIDLLTLPLAVLLLFGIGRDEDSPEKRTFEN